MKSLFKLWFFTFLQPAFGSTLVPGFDTSSEDYYGASASEGQIGSPSGSSYDSLISSLTTLGGTALLAYAPQNAGQATSPIGTYAQPGVFGTTVTGTSGIMGILLLGVAVLAGLWIWKKL